MPFIEMETEIHAPIERVFDLARSIDAHMASTAGTHEKAVAGRTSGLIGFGETVTWEAKHFGITQRLSVRVTAFDRPFLFRDEMIRGAFASMEHTHRFSGTEHGTMMKDEFQYTAPFGLLGIAAERLFLTHYMERFLFQRGLALKRLAESMEWKRYIPTQEDAGDGSSGCVSDFA